MKMRNKLFLYSSILFSSLLFIFISITPAYASQPFQMGKYTTGLHGYPLTYVTTTNGGYPYLAGVKPDPSPACTVGATGTGTDAGKKCYYAFRTNTPPVVPADYDKLTYIGFYRTAAGLEVPIDGITFKMNPTPEGTGVTRAPVTGHLDYAATWTRAVGAAATVSGTSVTSQYALPPTTGIAANPADYNYGTVTYDGFQLNCAFNTFTASLTLDPASDAAKAGAKLTDWFLEEDLNGTRTKIATMADPSKASVHNDGIGYLTAKFEILPDGKDEPTCTLLAEPKDGVASGTSVALTYRTKNAKELTIDNNVGTVPLNPEDNNNVANPAYPPHATVTYDTVGTETAKAKTYTMTVKNGAKQSTCTTTVTSVPKCATGCKPLESETCEGEKYDDTCGTKDACVGTKKDCPAKTCSVTIAINPSQKAVVNKFNPDVTITVKGATKAVLQYDNETPTEDLVLTADGNYDNTASPLNTHYFNRIIGTSEDVHGATVQCYDGTTPGEKASAPFTFKDEAKLPCPELCGTITKKIEGDTAKLLANGDYETKLNTAGTKDVDVDISLGAVLKPLTGSLTGATGTNPATAVWSYLSRLGDDIAAKTTVKTTPGAIGGGWIYQWNFPFAEPLRFTKYGKYSFNLVGFGEGTETTNSVSCNACAPGETRADCYSCPVPINIVRPTCTATPIITDIAIPASGLSVSDTDPKIIEFSVATLTGIVPDGTHSWMLEKLDTTTTKYNVVNLGPGTGTDSTPKISYTFQKTENLPKNGIGTYRLTLIASSMKDVGGKADPNALCNKVIDFTITSINAKCIMGSATGTVGQPTTVDIVLNSANYNGKMNIIKNNLSPVFYQITNIVSGNYVGSTTIVPATAGKYHIAINAELTPAGVTANAPTAIVCADPPAPLKECTATPGQYCNFTVTNQDGTGGGEVAL